MEFDFFSNFSTEQKKRYNSMLVTNFILLMCDVWPFLERDELERDRLSFSWIHSIKPTLEMFGLDRNSYPQGSLSANRFHYEFLRTYLGKRFYEDDDIFNIREGLKNFITLRQDDSGVKKSFLFGSYFEITKRSGSLDQHYIRDIHVSLRHSAAALWIMFEESDKEFSSPLKESLNAFLDNVESYLNMDEWQNEKFRHLTLSSIISSCMSVLRKCIDKNLKKRVASIFDLCKKTLFSVSFLTQNLDGSYKWIILENEKNNFSQYEYYFNLFVITQVPELIEMSETQSIIRRMIQNKVECEIGKGIPVKDKMCVIDEKEILPDFGITSSVLYLLYYSLTNNIGGEEWLKYCKSNFNWLLDFCLNAFDKRKFYIIPHSESNARVLLLPHKGLSDLRYKEIKRYISEIKKAIYFEMKDKKGKLPTLLKKIQLPDDIKHGRELILNWKISEYCEERHWSFIEKISRSIDFGTVGEFWGGFIIGALRAGSG